MLPDHLRDRCSGCDLLVHWGSGVRGEACDLRSGRCWRRTYGFMIHRFVVRAMLTLRASVVMMVIMLMMPVGPLPHCPQLMLHKDTCQFKLRA